MAENSIKETATMITEKTFWESALIRAIKTVFQSLGSMIPVGFVITPTMIEALDWSVVYVILAWIGTGLLAGLCSILTSVATGLPEVNLKQAFNEEPDTEEDADDTEEEGDMDE